MPETPTPEQRADAITDRVASDRGGYEGIPESFTPYVGNVIRQAQSDAREATLEEAAGICDAAFDECFEASGHGDVALDKRLTGKMQVLGHAAMQIRALKQPKAPA